MPDDVGLLFGGWVVVAALFVLVWIDAKCLRPPRLPTGVHKPVLYALGFLLTAGLGAVMYGMRARSRRKVAPVARPPLVLEGGTRGEAVGRKEDAADLAADSERADEEVDNAIVDVDGPPPDDVVDRLRERGVLGQ